jgi:hypothetical protein
MYTTPLAVVKREMRHGSGVKLEDLQKYLYQDYSIDAKKYKDIVLSAGLGEKILVRLRFNSNFTTEFALEKDTKLLIVKSLIENETILK